VTFDFSGVLFFPVTPFRADGSIDHDLLRAHVADGVAAGAGGVFSACGTGEFHALSVDEATSATASAADAVAGAVPVIAGAGGSIADATRLARSAREAGADGILLLPPYLVGAPAEGLRRYVEAVVEAGDLPVIVYHRGTAQYSPALMRQLIEDPRVAGFKDGTGDVARAQEIVAAVTETRPDFAFFNGLLTAELSQAAYRGIGIPLYSSAVFAMAPDIANAFYRAYTANDEAARLRLLREFYAPLVALRDEVPGFAVSLIKAGLRLVGTPVGSVRPPLVDPTDEQTATLAALLETGRRLAAELA
jgi:5-dehydro-4-deoxyglucarate dehydratase